VTLRDHPPANSELPTTAAGEASAPSNKPFALPERLRGLVPNYLNTCTTQIATLRTLVASGDFDAIRVVGHNLKGSGTSFGLPRVTEIGAKLEAGAAAAKGDEFPELIEQLAEAVAEGEQMVRSW
jgi:HPt (histidine-containing phosphotransfer) domain-containing protein